MKRIVAFLFSLVFAASVFAQDTYYVDATNGNDSRTATQAKSSSTPWKTIAKVISTVSDLTDDTVDLAGTFREGVTSDFRGKGSNITIQQWPGQAAAWIRGDTVLTGFTVDGGCYKVTVSAGLTVNTVTANWDTQINSFGQHYGHLKKATSKVNCQATDNSWYYSGTELDIRVGANADPAGYTITYVTGSLNGIAAGTTTSTPVKFTWKNLTFALWCSPTAGTGYGIKVDTTQNSLGDGNVYHDCGYHSSGYTNNNGVPMRNNWEKNASSYGITAAGDSAFVCYADSGGIDVESGFENCYVRLSPYLGMDGNPIPMSGVSSAVVHGIICHTGGTGTLIKKFVAKDCLVSVGTVDSSMTNRMGSYRVANTAQPGNVNDWRTYAAIFLRCDTTTGVLSLWKDTGAWVYSKIDLSQSGSSGAARVTNGGVLGDNASINNNAPMLFYGCDIRCNLDISAVASDHSMLFQVRGNTGSSKRTTVRLIGCSLINTSMDAANKVHGFFNQIVTSDTGYIYARQCIFWHRNTTGGSGPLNQLTYNNATVTPAMIDFKDCIYGNMDAARYTSGSNYNTTSLFTANVDPNGIYGTVNPFRDRSGTTNLELNAYGKSLKKFVSPNIIDGINRRQYGGSHNYGAYQYGKEAATVPPL